jgi:hypothetical protein
VRSHVHSRSLAFAAALLAGLAAAGGAQALATREFVLLPGSTITPEGAGETALTGQFALGIAGYCVGLPGEEPSCTQGQWNGSDFALEGGGIQVVDGPIELSGPYFCCGTDIRLDPTDGLLLWPILLERRVLSVNGSTEDFWDLRLIPIDDPGNQVVHRPAADFHPSYPSYLDLRYALVERVATGPWGNQSPPTVDGEVLTPVATLRLVAEPLPEASPTALLAAALLALRMIAARRPGPRA